MLDFNEVTEKIAEWYEKCEDADEVSELVCHIESINEQEFENKNLVM